MRIGGAGLLLPHLPLALHDLADGVDAFAHLGELLGHGLGEAWADDEGEADAHVEHAAHLDFGDVALIHEELEERGHGPGLGVDDRVHLGVQRAFEVADEAGAGDVGHAADHLLDAVGVQELDDRLHVDAGGGEEDLTEGAGRGGCGLFLRCARAVAGSPTPLPLPGGRWS